MTETPHRRLVRETSLIQCLERRRGLRFVTSAYDSAEELFCSVLDETVRQSVTPCRGAVALVVGVMPQGESSTAIRGFQDESRDNKVY